MGVGPLAQGPIGRRCHDALDRESRGPKRSMDLLRAPRQDAKTEGGDHK